MQPILDLSVLQFAQVAVDLQDEFTKVLGLRLDAKVAMQLRLLDHLPYLRFQQRQLGRVQRLALVVLVHQLLDPGDVAVAVRGRHRRDQVVDDGGVGAALGLRSLARVVDDERVEQRHVVQRHLRVAGRRHADPLARQPLQRAVLAQVENRIGAEDVAHPTVVGDVVVGGCHLRAVVDGDGVVPEAARGLQADEHVAQVDAGNRQASVGPVHLPRRLAPVAGKLVSYVVREGVKPAGILARCNVSCRQPELLLGQGVAVVAAPFDDAVDELVAGLRECRSPRYPASFSAFRTSTAEFGVSRPTALPMRASLVG